MAFVVDASVALAWHFDDEADPAADDLSLQAADEGIVVPIHWFAEVANGLLMGEKRGRTDLARIATFRRRLDALKIEVDTLPADEVLDRILPLARVHRLTVYDATYLELAERRGLAIATLDAALAQACRRVDLRVEGLAP